MTDNEWSDSNYRDLLARFNAIKNQRDDLISTLSSVAKCLGIDDWCAICEDPSVVLSAKGGNDVKNQD